jgi:hypothetical protein
VQGLPTRRPFQGRNRKVVLRKTARILPESSCFSRNFARSARFSSIQFQPEIEFPRKRALAHQQEGAKKTNIFAAPVWTRVNDGRRICEAQGLNDPDRRIAAFGIPRPVRQRRA